jgi:hypothetical protein
MSRQSIGTWILALLIVVSAAYAYLSIAYPEHVREHRMYLLESRPNLDFEPQSLSQIASESDLVRAFPNNRFRCYANRPGEYLGERSCFTDIDRHNDAPAMGASFFFLNGRLWSASILVPWWHHKAMRHTLVQRLGPPLATSDVHLLAFDCRGGY